MLLFSAHRSTDLRLFLFQIPNTDKNDPCVMGLYLPRLSELFPNVAFQEVQRRNAEISSALNFLYGSGQNKFPGKRNPELSSALLSYIRKNDRNY